MKAKCSISSGSTLFVKVKAIHHNWEIQTCDPLKHKIDKPIHIAFICMGKSISIQRDNADKIPTADCITCQTVNFLLQKHMFKYAFSIVLLYIDCLCFYTIAHLKNKSNLSILLPMSHQYFIAIIYLTLFLIETPLNAFANRADPDEAALVGAA